MDKMLNKIRGTFTKNNHQVKKGSFLYCKVWFTIQSCEYTSQGILIFELRNLIESLSNETSFVWMLCHWKIWFNSFPDPGNIYPTCKAWFFKVAIFLCIYPWTVKVACGEIFPDEFLIALHVTSKQLMVKTSINSTWNLHCGTLKVQYLVCLFFTTWEELRGCC